MAPSSTRSILVSTDTRKKKRRLRSLLDEFKDEASIFLNKYDRFCAKTRLFIENPDARLFLEEFGSYSENLEECLQKLIECNVAMTFDDGDGNGENVSDISSVVSGKSGRPISPFQTPDSASCARPVQNGECDSVRSQCTVLEHIERCEDKHEEERKLAGKEPEIVEASKEQEARISSCVGNSHFERASCETLEVEAEHDGGAFQGFVTCFASPSEFYCVAPWNLLYGAYFNSIMNLSDAKPVETAKLVVGQLYMSQTGGYWSRVKVILIETNSKVSVKRIDYGNATTVPVGELFPVPDELLVFRPLASRCSLRNLEPVGNDWSDECIEEMSSIVLAQTGVKIGVFESQDGVLHVDLFKKCECDSGELEVNLADYMVYRGYARYSVTDPIKQVDSRGYDVKPAGSSSGYACSFRGGAGREEEESESEWEEADVGIEDLEKAETPDRCDSKDSDPSWEPRYFRRPDRTIANAKVPCEQYGSFEATVCHVNSPADFYVYFQVDTVVQGLQSLDAMLKELCDKLSREDGERNKKLAFAPGTYCCARLASGEWCRCEIVEVDAHGSQADGYTVKVHALDIGVEEWVSVENVRPMTSDMFDFPAFAVKSSLGLIFPTGKSSEKDSAAQWCPEAVRWMKETCACFKLLFVNLLSQSDDETLSLLLFDFNDGRDILINETLCLLGLATSLKFKQPGDSEGDGRREDFGDCDPMADDYLSERNRLALDFDDAEMAVTNYKRQDEKAICHFYQRGRPCRKGGSCRFKHETPGGRVTTDSKEVVGVNLREKDLDGVDVGHVAVTAAVNPGRFYVNVFNDANGDKEYVQLFNSMQTYCREGKERQSNVTLRALGEMVAALFGDGFWYRARVVDVNDKYRRLKVFYVDTGASCWVSEGDTRDLPLEFCHCPTQAVNCFYRGLEPVRVDPRDCSGWSNAARTHFANLVANKVLQAHVTNRYPDGTLELELYDANGRVPRFIGDKMIEAGFASRQ